MGIVFITHEDVKNLSYRTLPSLLAGDNPWRILSPPKEGTNMGFGLQLHGMYQNQTNTMPDVIDHHGNKQAITPSSNFLDSEMNNSMVDARTTSGGVCPDPTGKPPSKLTWKDLSPTKLRNLSQNSSSSGGSSGDENPTSGVIWGEGSEVNKNQLVTWKQLSPTKLSPPADCQPDSGYSSNEVNLKIKEASEGSNSFITASQKPMKTSSGSTSNESPEDALEYFYDEDFSVQFEPNLSNPPMDIGDIGCDEMFILPQMLNGSYLSFESLKSSSDANPTPFEDQCELEFSDNQNSMEISTSERDMLCSSEMLELSSDPLFTPTPTSEAPPCHLLNDSLDRAVKNAELQGSKTSVDALHSSDAQLAMDCHLRKENYYLSFVGSQSKNSSSDVDVSVAASQGPESQGPESDDGGTNPSCGSSAEEAEEVCSNSFHFCRHEGVPSNYSTAARAMRTEHGTKSRLVGRLSSLPEQAQEVDQESTSSGMSECSSLGRIISHSLPRNSCSFQTFSSLKNKVNSSERPKTMVSWKQIKNMYRKGKQIPKPTDLNGKSSSMPDLCLRTWQKVAADRKKELESSEEEKGENKRYSATLVEMYQRMKAMGKALSPDIHIPGWSPNSSLSSRPGSGHWSVNSDEKGYNSTKSHEDGFSPICFEKTVWDTSNSHYHTVTAVNIQENAGQRDIYNNSFELKYQTPAPCRRSQATVVSPQSVNVWLGTKNFSAQFPPLTRDCGVQTSFDDECSMASGLRRNCKPRVPDANYLPKCHCHIMENNEKKTGENFRMPGKFAREVFYSHRSLPDLSFLTVPTPNLHGLRRHSIEKPGFVNSRLHRTSSTEEKESLQELKKLQRPEAMHISGPFCSRRPVMFRPIGGSRGADWHSSSSGLSTSSTSSGIDPGYLDYKYGSFGSISHLPCCAAFLDTRYLYNSAGFETLPRLIRQQEEEPQRKGRILERRYERYQYESHPAHARQKPWKKWSAGSSSTSSGTSVQTEALYSVAEEKTPTSPEKSMEENIGNKEFEKAQGEDYDDNQMFDDKSQLEAAVQRVRMRNTGLTLAETYCPDKRPLKSCLRKRQRSLSDPYGQSGWADNKSCTAAARQHRHSYGCDRDRMAGADGPEDNREAFDAIAASPDAMSPSDGSGSAVANSDPICGSNNASWSEKDMARSKKSVSFAREVSFHSPPCSPQVSPRRQSLQGRQVPHGGCNNAPSAAYWVNNMTAQPAFPVPRSLQSQEEDSVERRLEENQRSQEGDQPSLPQRAMERKSPLEKKSAMLAEVSKAAEALVAHFSKSKDPFDKLRLGSSIETPEVGELVLSQLCPAVAQVINDGLKPYESGLHVFGRVHITVWRVAEASAEPGPSTRAICDIVKELKNRPTLVSNKHRFDAFIFALLNSRLLDFWLGYLRHKDNLICHFYNAGALLQQLYINDLEDAYEEMLLSLQPLSVLPFQLDLDFVSGNSCHEPPNGEFPRLQDTATSLPDLRDGPPINGSQKFSLSAVRYEEPTEENALGHSAVKAWKWLSNSTASALPIAKSVMANVAQKVSPSISRLSSSMSRATVGDLTETKVIDTRNMDDVLLPVSDRCHDNREDEILSSADNSTLQGSSVKSFTVEEADINRSIETSEEKKTVPKSLTGVEKKKQQMKKESKNSMIDSKGSDKQKESLIDELFPDSNSVENLQQEGRPLSVSNLAHKFLGIGTGKRKQAYRKGVTEYSFDNEPESIQRRSQSVTSDKDDSLSRHKDISNKTSESLVHEVLDRYCEKSPKSESSDNELVQSNTSNSSSNSAGQTAVNGSSRCSLTKLETPPNTFDIIKLFDKLLLPNKPTQTSENRPTTDGHNKSAFSLFSWKTPGMVPQDSKSPTHELCKAADLKPIANKDQPLRDEVLKSDEAENSQEVAEETVESSPTMLYNWYTMEEPRDVYHDSTDEEHSPHLSESAESSLNSSIPQDQFRMPDYRYVRTLKASYTCTEKEGEILDFEVGEYLEVLAQLDRSWLYCANGQQEGRVRIGWTEPLIDQTIFETLHDNFYR